jgi:hypothetical protein
MNFLKIRRFPFGNLLILEVLMNLSDLAEQGTEPCHAFYPSFGFVIRPMKRIFPFSLS